MLRLFLLALLCCLSPAWGQGSASPSPADELVDPPPPSDPNVFSPNGWAPKPGSQAGWGSCVVTAPPPPVDGVPDGEIEIRGGRVEYRIGGDASFSENITLVSGDKMLTAEGAKFDRDANVFSVDGSVEFRDATTQVRASGAKYDANRSEVTFDDADFTLWSVPARGSGDFIKVEQEGKLLLEGVSYTSCPEGKNDWVLSASKITIDQEKGVGTARNAKLTFKRVPILWFPYLSYPASNERKSGWLIPDFGTNSTRGIDIEVPYYWNIAPQFDATLTPRLMTKRGVQLGSEFRYLTQKHNGVLTAEYLPNDDITGEHRALAAIRHVSDFTDAWRGVVHATDVSDSNYFEDLSSGLASTSQTHLLRRADLEFFSNVWQGLLRFENYQTIDDTIEPIDDPYQTAPKLAVRGFTPNGWLGLQYSLDGELAYFTRDIGVTGVRGHVMPEIALPLDLNVMSIEPAVAYEYTAYNLQDTLPGEDETPSRNAPIFSVDVATTLERLTPKRGWLQTLEPRILYAFIPFRDQRDLPVFDTIVPDLNVVQLFRRNRFVGYDRLGDTNQVSIGVTTRLIDAADGGEFLRATIGDILYFSDREVTLPGGQGSDSNKSDYLFELGMKLRENWRTAFVYQYNSDDRETKWTDVRLNYRASSTKIANFVYRYRKDLLEEFDVSAAWPIAGRWNLIGRYNYSILDSKPLESLVGAEYATCCWAIRTSVRRYLASRTGDSDTGFSIQLILKGFGSTDSAADRLLDRGILSYY
ncbi:MAG: LPS-assembly protein LptD [Gammaproteobacteria bacterium]